MAAHVALRVAAFRGWARCRSRIRRRTSTPTRIAFDRIDSLAPDSPQRAHEVLTWVPWLSSCPLIDEARACERDERFERVPSLCERQFGFALDPEYGYDSD